MHQKPVIYFDGVCNFCNYWVNFIIRMDKKKVFLFAALQSEAGQHMLKNRDLAEISLETFILMDNGKIYMKSSAALRLFNKLPWYWKWTQFFWIFPKFIRNAVYNFIARNRYKWFGKRDECMVPTPELRERFLSE
jgi:predicted DCC family thiol-disulfide oxidoreductase YuxK